ncbi:amidase [Amycolatopsis sp. cmx-11-12]|uniref:amidase n=1 Tax=Amycolatopsis sp. cmx-11-12 TaxID=2785795 RepID=UPI00391821A0
MTVLHELTTVEQCAALRAGEVSARELADHYLQRIEQHDEKLGAFVHVTAELARSEAARADEALRDGGVEGQPLLGLPMGFKDLYPAAGVPLTMGSAAIGTFVPPADGWAVGLLRKAGAVTLGTTHAPELGATAYTHSDVVGRPAVTPYDTARSAGGSSGGAAAAVAAGLLPAGHGSDGAGSIRLPAAVCGLVGLKPSRGRVSTVPDASFQSWATEGPLARTVADVALLLDVMAHPPAAELHRVLPPSTRASFLRNAQEPSERSLVVGVWTDNGLVDPEPEIVRAVARTSELLSELGHEVVEIRNPAPWEEDSAQALWRIFGGMVVAALEPHVPPERRHLLQDFTSWLVDLGERRTAAHHVADTDLLAGCASRFLARVEPYDVLLTPVTTAPPVPADFFHWRGVENIAVRMLEWAAYTPLQNWAGVPAMSLPVHVTPEGLPVGVQITASRHGDDALLLGLGAQLENSLGWQYRHPPQWHV